MATPVLSAMTNGFAGHLQHVNGGAVGFGACASTDWNPTAMGGSVAAVGQITSPIEINMNPTTLQLNATVMRLAYDEHVTGIDPQITFSIDAFSLWNIALAMSVEQDAISGSSILGIDMTYLKNGGAIVDTATLTDEAIANAGWSCCEVLTSIAGTSAVADYGTQSWQFWKVKIFQNGAMSLSGEAFTQIPVRVQAFVNDGDKVGQVVQTVAHTGYTYEA